ncbi:MAG: Fe-S-containing hydro-lyase [Clostridia bacterium]
MTNIKLSVPFTEECARLLNIGDSVLISGTIYTARDAAHARLTALLDEGHPLPFDITNAIIYYVGPTPAKPGAVIGSAGPTTSYRMDAYAVKLLEAGLRGMIGKGKRDDKVKQAIIDNHGVYFAAIGGAGALLSSHIVSSEIIAYEDLGSEAIRKLKVVDFPVVVAMDSYGHDLYKEGRAQYLSSLKV